MIPFGNFKLHFFRVSLLINFLFIKMTDLTLLGQFYLSNILLAKSGNFLGGLAYNNLRHLRSFIVRSL